MSMTLSKWMAAKKLDDEQVAAMVSTDRTTISRLRRGKQRPSWELAGKIEKATKGEVPIACWASASVSAA